MGRDSFQPSRNRNFVIAVKYYVEAVIEVLQFLKYFVHCGSNFFNYDIINYLYSYPLCLQY